MCDKSFRLLIYHPFLSSVYQGLIHTSLSLISLDLYHDISIFFDVIGKCVAHSFSLPVLLTFGYRATSDYFVESIYHL